MTVSADGALLGRRDLVVIGAGPVGVAALWFARRHGLEAIGVEASASPLESIHAFTPGLVTASTAEEWAIDGLPLDCRDAREVTREDLLSYYARVVAYGDLRFACQQRVIGLATSTGEVRVAVETEGGRGLWLAKHVLVTPWYRPRTLDLGDPRATGITVRHGVGSARHLGQELVVVGAGVSGLEACDFLIRAGARVTLLSRSKRALPPELATLFAVSGSRVVDEVTNVRVASRARLAVTHAGGVSEVACTVAMNCTGQEIHHDLLHALHGASLLSDAELATLRPFHRATLLDKRDVDGVAAQLPQLADAIWEGRRGVRFAGTIFHVGGIFGAGIIRSIETAQWAVASMVGAAIDDAPPRSAHLPSWFQARARSESAPSREPAWSEHLAAIVPVPVPTWSRGTKVFEGERATGSTGQAVSHETRALGDARSESLTALRDACYRGLSVEQIGASLQIDREDLLWGLHALWLNNGLTWIPPRR